MYRAEILKNKLLSDENVFGTNVLLPEAATCELMGRLAAISSGLIWSMVLSIIRMPIIR